VQTAAHDGVLDGVELDVQNDFLVAVRAAVVRHAEVVLQPLEALAAAVRHGLVVPGVPARDLALLRVHAH